MRLHHLSSPRAAFSLVEMAVVLTIISLLVGGVLVGQNMVRSSDIQATVTGVEEYRSAVMKFSDRFLELPGDFQTATGNWSGNGIADGNGNGRIGGDEAANPNLNSCTASDWSELWNVWVHLSKAELIPGEFTNTGNNSAVILGTNVPKTEINKGGYTLLFCGDVTNNSNYFNATYGHIMHVGNGINVTESTHRALFTTKEAAAIDGKLDDGYPHTGKVLAPKMSMGNARNCTTSDDNVPVTADYDFSQAAVKCPLYFILGF